MIEILDNNRMSELAESIVLDYLKSKNQDPKSIICVDIEGLAKDFFGLKIKYETICEDDVDKVAFSGNGIKPLKIRKNGKTVETIYPSDTIVLDKYFLQADHFSSRRFSIGHELGHKILSKVVPGHDTGNYHTVFDKERQYNFSELKSMMKICESQANQMSAALQMPLFLLKSTIKKVCGKGKFTVYGNLQMLPADSAKLKRMADDLGVAPTTLFIRLKGCQLIEYRPIEEFLKIIGLEGMC